MSGGTRKAETGVESACVAGESHVCANGPAPSAFYVKLYYCMAINIINLIAMAPDLIVKGT